MYAILEMEILLSEVAVTTFTSRRAFLTNTTLPTGPIRHVDPGTCPGKTIGSRFYWHSHVWTGFL